VRLLAAGVVADHRGRVGVLGRADHDHRAVRGASGLARQFIDWYAEYSGDPAPASLRHHYVAYRAFVRAKVGCVQAGQGDLAAAGQARQLADLARRHLRAGAVTMVLVGGLPGAGKSALAGALADRLGWTVLNSDRIRKELAGLRPEHPAAAAFEAGIYAEAWTNRCYGELLHRAVTLLADGESVIADASWISAEHRAAAATAAGRAGAELIQLRCSAPPGLAERRMAARQPGPSDADAQIARQMAAAMEPWPGATTIDTGRGGTEGAADESGPFGELVQEALGIIAPYGSGHVWRPSRPVMLPG
jgi:predicted kinase